MGNNYQETIEIGPREEACKLLINTRGVQITIQGQAAISVSFLEEVKENDKDKARQILVLKQLGMSDAAIAKNLGVSEASVRYWLSKSVL